ncbi:MAG: 50S ribosomal protein L14e, partial [Candidatus Heimdallarchaeota archaeon]|nr:50S ribosomal protein L14e [Candidatus Heimdallarchaeota archaeon]
LSSVKRRRCNIGHVEPTDKTVAIKRDATDEEVIAAIEKANLKKYMEEKIVP